MIWDRHAFAAVVAMMAAAFGAVDPAMAENRLTYKIELAGIGIGDMEIAVRRKGQRYDAQLDGSYNVLFWSGELSSRVEGRVAATGPLPTRFQSTNRSDEPSTTVITFRQPGGPSDWQRTPEAPAEWTEGRLPLLKEHLRAALDPVSALAASALQSDGGAAPDVCERAIRIFTGFVVFELDFQGVRSVEGNRTACAVLYKPLSGHREDSSSVERLSRPGSIEIVFERLDSGTWLPARVKLPTRVGSLIVERI